MINFYHVDVCDFFSASEKWDTEIIEYQKRLAITKSDTEKLSLQQLITRLSYYKKIFNNVYYGLLNENERAISDVFLFNKKQKKGDRGIEIMELKAKLKCGRGEVYRRKDRIEMEIQSYLELNYGREALEDFYHFFIRNFLEDSMEWKRIIKKLTIKKNSLYGLQSGLGTNSSSIHSGKTGDPTGSVVVGAEEIDRTISQLGYYFQVLSYEIQRLNQQQVNVLFALYPNLAKICSNRSVSDRHLLELGNCTKTVKIDEIGLLTGLSRTMVYATLNESLSLMQASIEDRFFNNSRTKKSPA